MQHRLNPVDKRPEIQVIKEYGQLPEINCYVSQLNQVFMNLLSNAIEALDEKEPTTWEIFPELSPIKISTEVVTGNDTSSQKANFVLIQIADNGCGISQEVQEQIFDPFFSH